MKLFLLFLFFISTAYAELEWKSSQKFPISEFSSSVCFTRLRFSSGSQFYYTLSDDCNLYNQGDWYEYVYIDNIEVYIRGTRNNESTTINENTDLVTVTAYAGNRHFYLNGENAKLTLRYLKLVGGDVSSSSGSASYGGSISIGTNGGELNLYSSIVFNNKAVVGGGIYAQGANNTNKNAIMNIHNSIIHNNTVTDNGRGGGIYIEYAVGTIYNTTIVNNTASSQYSDGGGMSIWDSDVNMTNTIISNNDAGYGGGGLYIAGDSTVTLRQSSFINNYANNGDEIYTQDSPTISLINTYFNNPNNIYEIGPPWPTWNTCSNHICTESPFTGTCIAVNNANNELGVICPSIESCNSNERIYVTQGINAGTCEPSIGEWNCAARTNQGIFTRSTDCTISENNHVAVSNTLEIVGNNTDINNLITITAANNQRHFYLNNANANLTLRYVKLVGGDVSSYSVNIKLRGGSIYIHDNGGELNLYSSIVFNNKAKTGGGIDAEGDSNTNKNAIMNIYNSIIHNNEATNRGGGIHMRYTVGTIYNTNIDNNQATNNGGGMRITSSDVTMKNTTISNNNASEGGGLYILGYIEGDDKDVSTTVTLRQSSFINNDATNQGDEICTIDSPTISLDNDIFKLDIYDSNIARWNLNQSIYVGDIVNIKHIVKLEQLLGGCKCSASVLSGCSAGTQDKDAIIAAYKELNQCG